MENCQKILQQGLQQLDIDCDEVQLHKLIQFIKLMAKWNKAYNLTAVRNLEDMCRLHILDSLAVLPFIHGQRVADIGTGAGLPGIPLAIFLSDTEFVLVDSNSKKTRFVQQAILELKLSNVSVQHQRVETFLPDTLFSCVTMRAFASLLDIILLTRHLLDSQGLLLAMKGQRPETTELAALKWPYTITELTVPGIAADRCLIQIEGVPEHG